MAKGSTQNRTRAPFGHVREGRASVFISVWNTVDNVQRYYKLEGIGVPETPMYLGNGQAIYQAQRNRILAGRTLKLRNLASLLTVVGCRRVFQ